MQGATSCWPPAYTAGIDISIHAPYAGGDIWSGICFTISENFNPRPLCRGRRRCLSLSGQYQTFQSTPPMQGATYRLVRLIKSPCYFNPRPLCRGRPLFLDEVKAYRAISIHAPYAGGDDDFAGFIAYVMQFQSTPPMQGATRTVIPPLYVQVAFQSTPPMQGATGYNSARIADSEKFQSTPPMQGATQSP